MITSEILTTTDLGGSCFVSLSFGRGSGCKDQEISNVPASSWFFFNLCTRLNLKSEIILSSKLQIIHYSLYIINAKIQNWGRKLSEQFKSNTFSQWMTIIIYIYDYMNWTNNTSLMFTCIIKAELQRRKNNVIYSTSAKDFLSFDQTSFLLVTHFLFVAYAK